MIKRFNNFLFTQASGAKIILMLLLTIASFYVMAFVVVPLFQEATAGLQPFDLNTGIDAQQMYQELPSYTDESRRLYAWFAVADYIYPIANAAFFALLWAWMFAKAPNPFFAGLRNYGILLLPFLFTLVDWSENLGFLIVIFNYPTEYSAIGDLAGVLKASKSKILYFVLLLTLLFIPVTLRYRAGRDE